MENKSQIPNIEIVDILSVEECRANPHKLYIYGSNIEGWGKGGQAIIRDEPNAFGIPTKVSPLEYMSDEYYQNNTMLIDISIWNLLNEILPLNKYKTLVFPSQGLGTGLANMQKECPKTFLFLCEQLLQYFNFNNIANLTSKPLKYYN